MDSPAPSTLAPGAHLGKYRIVAPVARGGMAELFLARADGVAGFEKLVALKRLLPELAARGDFAEMFLDEARLAATLDHPNVVHTLDVGVTDGEYFLAMEYLLGEDLETVRSALRMRDEPFPIEFALQIVTAVCAGLHYAHEKVGNDGRPLSIVHRDVTPHNIFVTWDGAVKLLDFGVAKAANRYQETTAGTIKGKVTYLSPEQCRSEPLDRRSDLFSLGTVLWELTLSRRLFTGLATFDSVKKIVDGRVPPPRSLDPSYPPALEAVVMRALEKKPARRYETARAMQEDLEGVARTLGLFLSQSRLTHFMERLFARKIEVWRDGERRGVATERLIEETRELSLSELVEMPMPEMPQLNWEQPPPDATVPSLLGPGDSRGTRELSMSELVSMPRPAEDITYPPPRAPEALPGSMPAPVPEPVPVFVPDHPAAWAVPLGILLGHLLAVAAVYALAFLQGR